MSNYFSVTSDADVRVAEITVGDRSWYCVVGEWFWYPAVNLQSNAIASTTRQTVLPNTAPSAHRTLTGVSERGTRPC